MTYIGVCCLFVCVFPARLDRLPSQLKILLSVEVMTELLRCVVFIAEVHVGGVGVGDRTLWKGISAVGSWGYTKFLTREVKEDEGTERGSQLNTICVQMDVML